MAVPPELDADETGGYPIFILGEKVFLRKMPPVPPN